MTTPIDEADLDLMNDETPVPEPDAPMPATSWLTITEAADALGADTMRVRRMLRDGELLAIEIEGSTKIPADLIVDGAVSRYLPGVITVLRDGGYDDREAVRWLLTPDESLGGNAALGLHKLLHREVSRRAQALAF